MAAPDNAQSGTDSRDAPSKFCIISVRSEEDLKDAITLFYEYAEWLNIDLKFQNFDQEMANMPGKYAPPTGDLLLARTAEGVPAGCVAVRKLNEGICEMKRLWVRDIAKGQGLGKILVLSVVDSSRSLGYQRMRLDTLPRMAAALGLYRSLGFVDVEPYYVTPLSGTHFLELDLTSATIHAE